MAQVIASHLREGNGCSPWRDFRDSSHHQLSSQFPEKLPRKCRNSHFIEPPPPRCYGPWNFSQLPFALMPSPPHHPPPSFQINRQGIWPHLHLKNSALMEVPPSCQKSLRRPSDLSFPNLGLFLKSKLPGMSALSILSLSPLVLSHSRQYTQVFSTGVLITL